MFLRKTCQGPRTSYGIHVARLAGVPLITSRAKEVLREIESESAINGRRQKKGKGKALPDIQLMLFDGGSSPKANIKHPVLEELKSLDVNTLNSIDALNRLNNLKLLDEGGD